MNTGVASTNAQRCADNPIIPPGYKRTEVGVIPEDWAFKALGPQVTITSGESPSLFQFGASGTSYFKVDQLNNSSKYLDSKAETNTPVEGVAVSTVMAS